MHKRPTTLVDLTSSKAGAFSSRAPRVNLSRAHTFRFPARRACRAALLAAVLVYLAFGSVAAPGVPLSSRAAAAGSASPEERAALERELAELERQIAEHEAEISRLQREGKSLQSEIGKLNAKVAALNLKIKSINLTLAKLDDEIEVKVVEIKTTEEKIAFNRGALGRALQRAYEYGDLNLVEILLQNPRLSDFVGSVSDLEEVGESLALTIERITGLKEDLTEEKEVLSLKREDAAALKAFQDAQRAQVEAVKREKNTLLKATKGKESEFQKLVKETKKTAAQVRSQIFELLGGGQLTFEEAYKFARFAEEATGGSVSAALILAVLDRESALGENVGRCSYKTAMHPSRDIPVFLELTASLGINPDTMLVSCAIKRDGAYGGAIGISQFIPSTWRLYAASVSELTGSSPPSPWRNGDAFVATALYLRDALQSSGCRSYAERNKSVLPRETLLEKCAAAKYYAGSRWFTYRFVYGDPIVERANRFRQDIAVLTS